LQWNAGVQIYDRCDFRRFQETGFMTDVIFLAASFAFFIVAVLYVYGCDSLKGGSDHA
jgi:hypothetical protein